MSMWAERSRCTWSCVDRSLASELEVLRQRSSGAELERGPQAPVTKVRDGSWCQAFVRFESRHRPSLHGAGRALGAAAHGGAHGFGRNQVQVLVIGDLIQTVAVLKQLPT